MKQKLIVHFLANGTPNTNYYQFKKRGLEITSAATKQTESTAYSGFHRAHLTPVNTMFDTEGFEHFHIRK